MIDKLKDVFPHFAFWGMLITIVIGSFLIKKEIEERDKAYNVDSVYLDMREESILLHTTSECTNSSGHIVSMHTEYFAKECNENIYDAAEDFDYYFTFCKLCFNDRQRFSVKTSIILYNIDTNK